MSDLSRPRHVNREYIIDQEVTKSKEGMIRIKEGNFLSKEKRGNWWRSVLCEQSVALKLGPWGTATVCRISRSILSRSWDIVTITIIFVSITIFVIINSIVVMISVIIIISLDVSPLTRYGSLGSLQYDALKVTTWQGLSAATPTISSRTEKI